MNKTLPNPYYLFSFQHIASKDRVSFIPEVVLTNTRYDKFRFIEGTTNPSTIPLTIQFPYDGQYYYSIYEQVSSTNTNIDLTYNKLESGRAVVIVGDDQTDACFFEPYISNNEDDANIIYISEEEQLCISGETIPQCPIGLTGECPTYFSRSFDNKLYFKNTGDTYDFISTVEGCSPTQIAMDESRLFFVDGCSTYYEYNYTITPEGCFNPTLVKSWEIWDQFDNTPNASRTLALYDQNTLIVGESQTTITSTGSTLYLYDLTTSGLTKWLELSGGKGVYNVYYNTGNTQMITSYLIANSNDYYYALYSGSTNPQLLSEIPVNTNGGEIFYFSGNTPISVNAAGVQHIVDFSAGTLTLIAKENGVPILYIDYEDGFAFLSNIVQPASCYDFRICPSGVTTQYLNVELSESTKFTLSLWNDPLFTSVASAECEYVISGVAYGSLGTVFYGTETINQGQHQRQFNLSPVLLPGEVVVNFEVLSYDLGECICVDLILPVEPTPTPTNTVTPTMTPTNTQTPTTTPTPTPTKPSLPYNSFMVATGSTSTDACTNLSLGNTIQVWANIGGGTSQCTPCLPLNCFPCVDTDDTWWLDELFTIPLPDMWLANYIADGGTTQPKRQQIVSQVIVGGTFTDC